METALVQRTTRASAPESIDEDLRALWRAVARESRVTRAAMANLVVFVPDKNIDTTEVPLDDVVRHHPSRVVVLRHAPAAASACRPTAAAISIVAFGPPHARYAVEEIALRATCGEASLPSIVRRFTQGDLPTSLWWTEDFSQAAPILALARMARQLVYDSSRWRDIGAAIAALAPLLHSRNAPRLADINWRRLAAVRQAMVDAARALLPAAGALPRLEIRHRAGDSALAWLLAGWLASRLGWPDGGWPVDIRQAAQGDEVLALHAGNVAVTMNGRKVVATTGGRAPVLQIESRRESVAAAVAAELATLTPDTCLVDALSALSRQPSIR